MGSVKRYFDEMRDEDFLNSASEIVCSRHFENDFIKKFIRTNGSLLECSYCKNKTRKSIKLSKILKIIKTGIDYRYEDANQSLPYDPDGKHGFRGNTFVSYDLFYNDFLDLNIEDENLFNDIYEYLKTELVYYPKNMLGSESEYLGDLWDYFKHVVKHEARYVFYYDDQFSNYHIQDPAHILKMVEDAIIKFSLFRTVKTNTKLHRCRQHEFANQVTNAEAIAANPLANCKFNNRMSPAGISMLYCSPYRDVAISEVIDGQDIKKPFYTTAYFRPLKHLKLIDLTKLPPLPSILDEDNNKDIETIIFLKNFLQDISKKITPGDEIIDYIPSQIVTEYIKFNELLSADGIIYFSSKDTTKENFVLFMNHEQSLEQLKFSQKSISTHPI